MTSPEGVELISLLRNTSEVTSFFYEWRFNSAFERCRENADKDGIDYLKQAFIEYSLAQLRYDAEVSNQLFGYEVKAILLGHNVPFFAEVISDLLAALINAGVTFIPFDEAAADPAYNRAATGVTDKFLIYQQKLALLDGAPVARVAPECVAIHDRVAEMARS